jgi:two-component system, chemotaxis family, protein-glutamate methylesterase/glutaminase
LPTAQIICIGASAGGIEALRLLVAGLPADINAAIIVVLHTSSESPGIIGAILDHAGALPAANAVDGEHIQPGRIYVAPPDYHLLVEPGLIRLTRGPKENRFRPAIDPLFRSAASVYGPLAVGIILSGSLDDGTVGLRAIKQLGGTTIVQDPEEALFSAMPRSAMEHVRVDYCLPVAEIASVLTRLARGRVMDEEVREVPEEMEIENRIAGEDNAIEAGVKTLGDPSSYACPECHGVLLQLKDEKPLRFRCHTGHAYSVQSLLAEVTEKMEESLWSAIRSFEEGAMLMRQMAGHTHEGGKDNNPEELLRRAQDTKRRAELIKQAVTANGNPRTSHEGEVTEV